MAYAGQSMPDPNAERAVEILHRGGRNAGLDEDEVMELALRTVGVVRTINALRDTLARQGCTQAQCDQAVRIFEEHVILGIEEASGSPGKSGLPSTLGVRTGPATPSRH